MSSCCPRSGQSMDYFPYQVLKRAGCERGRGYVTYMYRCTVCDQLFYSMDFGYPGFTFAHASEQLTRKRYNLGYRRTWVEPYRPTHKTERWRLFGV